MDPKKLPLPWWNLVILLHWKCKEFSIQEYPTWKGLDAITLAFTSMKISPSCSPLVKGILSSWNRFKRLLIPKISVRFRGQWLHLDSIWFNIVHRDNFRDHSKNALKLFRKGIKTWINLWNHMNDGLESLAKIKNEFKVTNAHMLVI